jgi:hypothetical protein
MADKLSAAMRIAERVYSLAQELADPRLMIGAYRVLAGHALQSGDFESARQHATRWLAGLNSQLNFPIAWRVCGLTIGLGIGLTF